MRAIQRTLLRLLVPAGLLAGAAACDGVVDLDETPETFVAPGPFRSADEGILAVNGIYQPLMTWDNWINPAWHEVACESPDIFCPGWYISDRWWAGRTWTANYQIVRRANDVLFQLDQSDLDPQVEERLRGEAHFLRGYAYFELVRRYGTVPLRVERYQPDGTFGDSPRAPLADVYRVIVNDLKAAGEELPANFTSKTYADPTDRGRPVQPSAWGLLSKVYLTMAGKQHNLGAAYNDSARIAAARVMASGWVALEDDYMRLYDVTAQISSNEILFQVGATHRENTGPELPGTFAPQDYSLAGGGGGGFLSVRRAFYQTFDTINDKRVRRGYAIFDQWRESGSPSDPGIATYYLGAVPASVRQQANAGSQNGWTWTEGCETVGAERFLLPSGQQVSFSPRIFTMKYVDRGAATKSQNSNNPIVLRYADVLLVFAEAENEAAGAPTAAAYNAINQVRRRAGLGNLSGLNQAQFREAVWLERRHELYAEFQDFFDFLREGRWLEYMSDASDAVPTYPGAPDPNADVCLPRQAYQMLLQIPSSEIGANSLITQNPGY